MDEILPLYQKWGIKGVNSQTVLTADMAPNGGHVIRIVPHDAEPQ